MKKAFTLIELMVAMGLLAMVIGFASVIFRVSIDSQRSAAANSEIMQKLRVIVEQLDADFKGCSTEYPGYMGLHTDKFTIAGKAVTVNSDCIAFFANGDFQSTQQYGGQTVVGNVACIVYCQPDPNSFIAPQKPQDRILFRRQTILTAANPTTASNPRGEYYSKSLSEWQVGPPFIDGSDWVRRPVIDPNILKDYLPMYMAKGVDNFTIKYAEYDTATQKVLWKRSTEGSPGGIRTNAFKFEFTFYDSKGFIKNGRTFTHIIFLGS
jgi:prepilin-type N-terminal cleavage/methylation domain-containing protein